MKIIYILSFLIVVCGTCFADGEGLNTVVFKHPPFSITKPSDWNFVPRQPDSNVLTTMLKHEEPFNGFNTSITVRVFPLGEAMQDKDASQLLSMMNEGFKEGMPDYKAISKIIPMFVADRDAASIEIDYTYKLPDGQSFSATSKTVVIPMGSYFFVVAYSGPRESREDDLYLFNAVLNQITVE